MKLIFYIVSFLFCLTLLSSFKQTESTNWKFEKNKNGIQVYSRLPEGQSIKEVKVYTLVKTSLSSALAVLMDVPSHPNWIYNCAKTEILEKINNQEMIFYSVSDIQWPMEDRDLVIHNTVHQDQDTKIIRSISIPKLGVLPKKKGRVRITNMYSEWKFTPRKNGFILVEYYLRIDPGGNVPIQLSNALIQTGPYRSVLNFKEAIKLEKYKNVTFDFIDEPTN